MKPHRLIVVCHSLFAAAAVSQTSYPDETGDVTVTGGPFPHLDITSVDVEANTATNQIAFTIFVDGDPTNPNWGNYMIGLKSGAGGAPTGTGWAGRPIDFPVGMTHWIGTWNTGGEIWTYSGGWAKTGSVTPVKDATLKSITLTIPFSSLDLEAGEAVLFDVYSSGGGGTDSAVDALSAPTGTITNWNDLFSSAEPLGYTMPTASDTDADGLPDAWEVANFGNLSQGGPGDPDGDLLDNAAEFGRSTNPNQPDTDTDGLSDLVENNAGVYAGAAAPGTSPVDNDSDDDGFPDGAEASGTALGFESNPLLRNYAVFAVPGTFNTPLAWDPAGASSPTNTMSRDGIGLTTQYQYALDYRFSTNGQAIEFKFAGGSWSDNWGGTTGTGVLNGPNIKATIVATGIHRFRFDLTTLAYTFSRPPFPSVDVYLAAYGLTASPAGDADSDGLSNSAEFTANSDPENPDTDGDGLTDDADPNPLAPPTAYDLWAGDSGLLGAEAARPADPDADGGSNLYEFLFGGNPRSGVNVPISIQQSGADVFVQWIGRASSTEASYSLESSSSFVAPWNLVTASPEAAPDQGGVPVGYMRWQASVPRAGDGNFLRVRGTEL